jgi:TatA/E family protein of Tat protein translocase
MPFNIQGPELIILLVIALLVLGPGKLPEVGSALGKSIREFRKAATDVKDAATIEPARAAAAAPAEPPPLVAAPPPVAPAPLPAEPVAAAPVASSKDTPAS